VTIVAMARLKLWKNATFEFWSQYVFFADSTDCPHEELNW